jgi:hypothetical protein
MKRGSMFVTYSASHFIDASRSDEEVDEVCLFRSDWST